MRVGLGFDSHRFDPSRTLVLGGVLVDDRTGLSGPADGDAVSLAVIEALRGATGLGGLEDSPPADEEDALAAGSDSMALLASTVRKAEGENYHVVNADVTVVTAAPSAPPAAYRMEEALADRLHVSPGHVSVKRTSNDRMGWIGEGEGLAVLAVVLVDRVDDPDLLHASLRSGG